MISSPTSQKNNYGICNGADKDYKDGNNLSPTTVLLSPSSSDYLNDYYTVDPHDNNIGNSTLSSYSFYHHLHTKIVEKLKVIDLNDISERSKSVLSEISERSNNLLHDFSERSSYSYNNNKCQTNNNLGRKIKTTQKPKKNVHFLVDQYDTIIADMNVIDRIPDRYKKDVHCSGEEHDEMRISAFYGAEDFIVDHSNHIETLDRIIEHCYDTVHDDVLHESMLYEWSASDGRGLENIFSPVLRTTSQTAVRNVLNYQEELRHQKSKNVNKKNRNNNDMDTLLRQECIRCNEGSAQFAQLLALGDMLEAQGIHLGKESEQQSHLLSGSSTLSASFSSFSNSFRRWVS